MKIFWKCVDDGVDLSEAPSGIQPNGVNRIEVPNHTLEVVRYELDVSRRMLPPSHLRDGEWRVGLLNRFDFKKEDAFRNQYFVVRRS
jgi:hypothetical protein